MCKCSACSGINSGGGNNNLNLLKLLQGQNPTAQQQVPPVGNPFQNLK